MITPSMFPGLCHLPRRRVHLSAQEEREHLPFQDEQNHGAFEEELKMDNSAKHAVSFLFIILGIILGT